jgi:hypothetical protein
MILLIAKKKEIEEKIEIERKIFEKETDWFLRIGNLIFKRQI